MEESLITIPGKIIFIKIGEKDHLGGFYAHVNDVLADHKRGWWQVKFFPLVGGLPEPQLVECCWILDDQQIRGERFTMKGTPYQLLKVDFEKATEEADNLNRFAAAIGEDKPSSSSSKGKNTGRTKSGKAPHLVRVK